MPDMTIDPEVLSRKEQLKGEAKLLIEAIRNLEFRTEKGGRKVENRESTSDLRKNDPLLDPKNLANAVRFGFLDAPELTPTANSKGTVTTSIIDGACYAVNPETEEIISEEERLDSLRRTNEMEGKK